MESGLLELFSSLEDCRRDCTGPLKIEDIFGFSEVGLHEGIQCIVYRFSNAIANDTVHAQS